MSNPEIEAIRERDDGWRPNRQASCADVVHAMRDRHTQMLLKSEPTIRVSCTHCGHTWVEDVDGPHLDRCPKCQPDHSGWERNARQDEVDRLQAELAEARDRVAHWMKRAADIEVTGERKRSMAVKNEQDRIVQVLREKSCRGNPEIETVWDAIKVITARRYSRIFSIQDNGRGN